MKLFAKIISVVTFATMLQTSAAQAFSTNPVITIVNMCDIASQVALNVASNVYSGAVLATNPLTGATHSLGNFSTNRLVYGVEAEMKTKAQTLCRVDQALFPNIECSNIRYMVGGDLSFIGLYSCG
jgi:hypothetical protein